MPDFVDVRKVSPVIYLAVTHPDQCLSHHYCKPSPICGMDPLTVCSCRKCYPLAKVVLRKHGHEIDDYMKEWDYP